MNIIHIKQRAFTVSKAFFVAIVFSHTAFGFINFNFINRKKVASPIDFTYKKPFSLDVNRFPLGSFNSVKIVQDKKKNIFIIKNFHDPEQAIHEVLGAYIGALAGIRINKVKIIPSHMRFVGKDDNCAATIHTCVPGQEVEKVAIAQNIYIRGGLTSPQHLQSLVLYDDLCSIVALDIFLDNYDRHNGNLFFDEKSGYFYAIDMDRIFCFAFHFKGMNHHTISDMDVTKYHSLAIDAYNFLITLVGTDLSSEEIRALNHVRDWLNKLLSQYSSVELYKLWINFADKVNHTYAPLQKVCIQTFLDCNCAQVKQVITQINTLVVA